MFSCSRLKKTSDGIHRLVVQKKNQKMADAFASTPYNERVVFVPHCLRSTGTCKAKESGSFYMCVECGGCKTGVLSKKSRELGYKAFYMVKGGRAIENLLKELKPGAVLGIACYYEGALGMKQASRITSAVQFVPLTKDGCANTDVDVEEALRVLTVKKEK